MIDRPEVLLLATIFLPALETVWIALVAGRSKDGARQSALVTTLVTFAMAAVLLAHYDDSVEPYAGGAIDWIGRTSNINIQLSIGLDGLSLWLFGLSALLSITSVLVSWESIQEKPGTFYALLLLLETGMLGVFCARDIILFYIFFEFTLIPLFFLIGIWGSEDRRYAAGKFFLYTLAGSLLTFLGLMTIVLCVYVKTQVLTFSIAALTDAFTANPLPAWLERGIFLALFAGFAIKVPLFPFHTWLPLAHVQAPTAGSVILAGILLKIGTYGFLRFSMPMLPDATAFFAPWMLGLAVVGIIYGALVALAQSDMKRLIAYSSVSHLGFCMLGLFAFNKPAMQGAVLQMINHGLSTGGLFALVGMIYERYHTREISHLGGLARTLPVLSFFLVLFTFSSIGLPGLNGFAGEFPVLLGMFQRAWLGVPPHLALAYKTMAVLSVFGVVLGAWYMLWLVERVLFGPVHAAAHGHGGAHHAKVPDMKLREFFALAPLAVLLFWIGLAPGMFFDRMNPAVDRIVQTTSRAFEQREHAIAKSPPTVPSASGLARASRGGGPRVD